MNERTDRFRIGDASIELPVAGVFEVGAGRAHRALARLLRPEDVHRPDGGDHRTRSSEAADRPVAVAADEVAAGAVGGHRGERGRHDAAGDRRPDRRAGDDDLAAAGGDVDDARARGGRRRRRAPAIPTTATPWASPKPSTRRLVAGAVDDEHGRAGADHVAVAEAVDGCRRRQAVEHRASSCRRRRRRVIRPCARSATSSRSPSTRIAVGAEQPVGEHRRLRRRRRVAQQLARRAEHDERRRRTAPRRWPASAGRRAGGGGARRRRRRRRRRSARRRTGSSPSASTARPCGPSRPGGDSTRWRPAVSSATRPSTKCDTKMRSSGADGHVVDAERHLGEHLLGARRQVDGDDPPGAGDGRRRAGRGSRTSRPSAAAGRRRRGGPRRCRGRSTRSRRRRPAGSTASRPGPIAGAFGPARSSSSTRGSSCPAGSTSSSRPPGRNSSMNSRRRAWSIVHPLAAGRSSRTTRYVPSGSRAVTRPNIGSVAYIVPSAPKMASSGPAMPRAERREHRVGAGLDVDRRDLRAEHLRHVQAAVGPERHPVGAAEPARRRDDVEAPAGARRSASGRCTPTSDRQRPSGCATRFVLEIAGFTLSIVKRTGHEVGVGPEREADDRRRRAAASPRMPSACGSGSDTAGGRGRPGGSCTRGRPARAWRRRRRRGARGAGCRTSSGRCR